MPAASTIKSEEREFAVDSGASVHVVSKRERPYLCRIGNHEDIEESDDSDDDQRRDANRRRSHGICQRIGLFRQTYAS